MSTHPLLAAFLRSDSSAMVAGALHILSVLAADPGRRHDTVAPWAWDLRRRARQLEAEGMRISAAQARVVARVVEAVAMGELTAEELSAAAASVHVDATARAEAIGALVQSMMVGVVA